MARYLPDDLMRCSALWYALRTGMVDGAVDFGDLEFLRELGAQAACRARWHGIPEWRVPEGPWPAVCMWPEWVWSATADSMAHAAAEHGDYTPVTRVVNCRSELYDVLIDRSTPWGNPYRIGPDGDRGQVIAAYERYLAARPDLLAALGQLRGKRLGCHCAPAPCHGDVLARYADNPATAGAMRIYASLPGSLARDPACERCDYDTHRCPGCGEPLPHGAQACAACDPTAGRPGDWGARGYSGGEPAPVHLGTRPFPACGSFRLEDRFTLGRAAVTCAGCAGLSAREYAGTPGPSGDDAAWHESQGPYPWEEQDAGWPPMSSEDM